MPRIQRTSDEGPLFTAGEAITNWPVGRIYPTPKRVPSDWNLFRLTAIARLESGHTPSRRVPKYWDGGVPWISLHDSDSLESSEISATAMTISQAGLDNSSARLLPKGTVVFSRTATVGKATIMGREMATSQDFANYVCGDQLDNRYLVYLFRFMEPEWKRLMAGSTHNSIYMPVFQEMAILLPPICEQHRIADALSDVDTLIESLEQLLAKKRQIKQGAMQELLTGKKRLPGFSDAWETKTLGELGESLIGLTYTPTDVKPHGVLVLRSSNISEGVLRFDDNVFVGMEIPEKIMVQSGDILICVRNGSRELIGKCAMIDDSARGMTFGAFMAVFRSAFHNFIFHQFQSDLIRRQINEHLGATINQITNKSLNSFRLPLPSNEQEQRAIANTLTDMNAEIAALEAKFAKAHQLKQGMMQELLTGRIRLI